jgi:hypothetical protein
MSGFIDPVRDVIAVRERVALGELLRAGRRELHQVPLSGS